MKQRFIPAGAGNTSCRSCASTSLPVYPRWRGEHSPLTKGVSITTGLSPLARGTPDEDLDDDPVTRFIPAGAGNTQSGTSHRKGWTVYPRWRGEHCWGIEIPVKNIGLSPLARGTPRKIYDQMEATRFIPAGAGNTFPLIAFGVFIPVYPRWRGEHILFRLLDECPDGLSPLARGTRGWISHAGRRTPVYPRWRGEHIWWLIKAVKILGLSPLARGTLCKCWLQYEWRRFIPAGAGNTFEDLTKAFDVAVYPRWRGEHSQTLQSPYQCRGLSPLARGTHQYNHRKQNRYRFIPAGAGNTLNIYYCFLMPF